MTEQHSRDKERGRGREKEREVGFLGLSTCKLLHLNKKHQNKWMGERERERERERVLLCDSECVLESVNLCRRLHKGEREGWGKREGVSNL